MRAIDIVSIIIILSLSLWSWGGNAQIPAPAVSGFRLNLQWPAAFCEVNPGKCKTPIPDSFTIHGLWPHNRAWKLLENCRGSSFAANSIPGALRADLNEFWPTVTRDFPNNQDFWRYEWEKHGVCSESVDFKQTVYFQKAIALRKVADVLGALNQEGIKPDGNTYLGRTIKAAIVKHLKARPELSCPQRVLLAINLCVNRLATTFVDCPASANCENANLKILPPVSGFHLNLQWPAAFCELNPGIKPDGRKTYLGRNIIAAIKKNLNARPDLVCSQGVLLEIKLCVDKPARQFLDCPGPANCDTSLKFIPVPKNAPRPSLSLYTPI